MKRKAPLARHTPLQSRSGLTPSSDGLKRTGGPTRQRRKPGNRVDRLFRRCFHSEAFVEFTKAQPCVCRGLGREWGCEGVSQTSHDPTRGAGGTWMDTHPASVACHRLIEANDFWHRIGRTREQANREHHMSWLDHLETLGHFAGGTEEDLCDCGAELFRWKTTDRHIIYRCERGHDFFVERRPASGASEA